VLRGPKTEPLRSNANGRSLPQTSCPEGQEDTLCRLCQINKR